VLEIELIPISRQSGRSCLKVVDWRYFLSGQQLKVKKGAYSSSWNSPQNYETPLVKWDHTVLSATRQRWLPRLHPNRTGWYSIYRPHKDERLSWPSWLVTYRNGLPVHRRSPIRVLTGSDVAQLRWSKLFSQPQSVTTFWPVPNYTAWWQRHNVCVNELPRPGSLHGNEIARSQMRDLWICGYTVPRHTVGRRVLYSSSSLHL